MRNATQPTNLKCESPEASPAVHPSVVKLVPAYLERRREELGLLRHWLDNRDWAKIESLGHKLGGSGATYGLPWLGELGRKLEAEAARRDQTRLRAIADEIENQLRDASACASRLPD